MAEKTLQYRDVHFPTQSKPLIHPSAKGFRQHVDDTVAVGQNQESYMMDSFCVSDGSVLQAEETIKSPIRAKVKRRKRIVTCESSSSDLGVPLNLLSPPKEAPCPNALCQIPNQLPFQNCQFCGYNESGNLPVLHI